MALDLAADEESNHERLVEHIESDPRLLFAILIGANFPLFAGHQVVKTVRHAVARIGRQRTQSLFWLLALSDMLQTWHDLHPRTRELLWRHSLLTGVVAQRIVQDTDAGRSGIGLSAGIAHDIGHLLVLTRTTPLLGIVRCEQTDELVKQPATALADRNHCGLGASLLEAWNAPPELIAAARFHHAPWECTPPHRPLVAAVRMADLIAEHVDQERAAPPLRLDEAPAWRELATLPPWNNVPDLHWRVLEGLSESLLLAEHLSKLLAI